MANIVFSEASNVNDSIYGKSQAPIRMFIEKKGEQFESESIVKQIFRQDKSTHFGERYTSLTAMEGFEAVGENGAYPTDGFQEGYSKIIEAIEWKDSFRISQKMIEDSQLMDLRQRPAAFVTAYYRGREKLGAAALGAATQGLTSTTYMGGKIDLTGADGVALFATNHPSKVKGGTQTNKFADEFDRVALGKLETRMQTTKGDNGEILDVMPDTIIIPNLYQLKEDVFAAIGSDKVPETANNAWNYQVGRWNVIVWSYLNQFIAANKAPWILMDSKYNQQYGSLIWLDRVALTIRSSIDENTDANVWRGRARYTVGVHDWRGFAVGGVTGGSDL